MRAPPVGAPGQAAGEGCFLRTLNIGCMLIAGFVLLVFVLYLLHDSLSHS
jgi:hypothetical protein